MRFNIQWILAIRRYDVILGGFELVTRRQSPYRNGNDNWIKLVLPQRMPGEGAVPKNIGRHWFRSGKSMGDPS